MDAPAPGSTPADHAFFGHPRALGWLSTTEFWERFSYYGMQSLLVLYMTHRLLLPGHIEHVLGFGAFRALLERLYGHLSAQALASVIFGLYAGLVYVTPIAGGLLADRVLGRSRTVLLGAALMAAGHFLMASEHTFLIALLCLLAGAGCFKGNLAAQVGMLYPEGDARSADGFQIYFIAINVAVIVSPLVCGTLGERAGYHWGFAAAGIGMLIGLLTYLRARAALPADTARTRSADGRRAPRAPFQPGDRRRLFILLALLPVLGAALAGNFQIFNAYLLWSERTYRLEVFGFHMPVTWLLSIGSLISVAILAGSVLFWRWWATHREEPPPLDKMTAAAFILGAAQLILAAGSALCAATGRKLGLEWAVAFEIVNDIGYANLLPVGLSLYARAAPKALGGMMTGVYYVHLFFASMLVGWLGGFLERVSATRFWLMHAALVFGAALVLLAVRLPLIAALAPPADATPRPAAAGAGA